MTAKIIDGQAIANQIQEEIKEKVAARVAAGKTGSWSGNRAGRGRPGVCNVCEDEAKALRQAWGSTPSMSNCRRISLRKSLRRKWLN